MPAQGDLDVTSASNHQRKFFFLLHFFSCATVNTLGYGSAPVALIENTVKSSENGAVIVECGKKKGGVYTGHPRSRPPF